MRVDPSILQKNLPPAWKAAASVASAVAITAAAGSSQASGAERKPPEAGAPAIVAPEFLHGGGRGSTGCVAISPPVFLSEEEAMQVIREELGKHGIRCDSSNTELPGVEVPTWIEIEMDLNDPRSSDKETEIRLGPLEADLFDKSSRIAIEYVSAGDDLDLYHKNYMSSAAGYDLRGLAQRLRESASKGGKGVILGLFYDPMCPVSVERDREAASRMLGALVRDDKASESVGSERVDSWFLDNVRSLHDAEICEEHGNKGMLRMQVKDFAEWLKGQGLL